MEWRLASDVPTDSLVIPRVLEQGPIPVILFASGRYPKFVSSDGTPHEKARHVQVSLSETITHSPTGVTKRHVGAYSMRAVGPHRGHYPMSLPLIAYRECEPARTADEVNALLDGLKPIFPKALEKCRTMESIYEVAERRTDLVARFANSCTTRAGYENACAVAGVDAYSDAEIGISYGITYGVYTFPEYDPDTVVKMGLARHRKRTLDEEARAAAELQAKANAANPPKPYIPERNGQMWEPCRCGREPVYQPLMVCKECWPKA